MDKIINSPYNINAVARVDSDNIVHNHIYHHCPIGRVDDNNFVYDNNNNIDIIIDIKVSMLKIVIPRMNFFFRPLKPCSRFSSEFLTLSCAFFKSKTLSLSFEMPAIA